MTPLSVLAFIFYWHLGMPIACQLSFMDPFLNHLPNEGDQES